MAGFTASDELGEMEFQDPSSVLGADNHTGWRNAHLLFCWLLGSLAVFATAEWRDLGEYLSLYILVCGVLGLVLWVSWGLRFVVHEATSQLGVREKFAAMLVFVVLGVFPRFMGIEDFSVPLMIYLILSATLCVNPTSYGRYVLFCMALVGTETLFDPPIANLYLLGFMVLLVLTLWLEYVRFRLESESNGIPLSPLVLIPGILPNLLLSLLVALLTLGIAGPSMVTRVPGPPELQSNPNRQEVDLSSDTLTQLFTDAAIILVVIIILLVLMNWIERRFRVRKNSRPLVDDRLGATYEGRLKKRGEEQDTLREKTETEARARIIQRFREYITVLSRYGWSRRETETPREYFQRTAYKLLAHDRELDPRLSKLYNRACYSPEEITPDDAKDFVDLANSTETEITTELERLKERAAYLEALKKQQLLDR
jgi:hypothetical protein